MKKLVLLLTLIYFNTQILNSQSNFNKKIYTLDFKSSQINDNYYSLKINLFYNKFILNEIYSGEDVLGTGYICHGDVKIDKNQIILNVPKNKLNLTLQIENDSTLTFIKGLNFLRNIHLKEWRKDLDNLDTNIHYGDAIRSNEVFIQEFNSIDSEYSKPIKSLPQVIKNKINYEAVNTKIDTGIYIFKTNYSPVYKYKIIIKKKKYLLCQDYRLCDESYNLLCDTNYAISFGNWYVQGNVIILKDINNDYSLKFLIYKKHLIPLDYWYYYFDYIYDKMYSKDKYLRNGFYKVEDNVNNKTD